MDCERETTSQVVLEARRNEMQHDISAVFEIKLHGWFKNHSDDAGFADTLWVPLHRLKHLPVGVLNKSVADFLKASRDAYIDTVSSWFEECEDGDEREDQVEDEDSEGQ